jgi:two-component system, cell cycle sensor histidine kinase and response regulator CckA
MRIHTSEDTEVHSTSTAKPLVLVSDFGSCDRPAITGEEISAETESHRVLLVDDTPAVHEDFRKILIAAESTALDQADCELFGTPTPKKRRKNFVLNSAYQGQEGLAKVTSALAESQPYSLVFLDIRMPPGWDGIETLAHLWKADPDLQVVICTAYSDYSWGQISERFGSTDSLVILKKPFDNIEVLQLAHTLTKKWDLTREAKKRFGLMDATVTQRTEQLRESNRDLLREIAERKGAEARIQCFSALGQKLSATKTARDAARIIVDVADELIGWDSCQLELYSKPDDSLVQVLAVDFANGKRERSSTGTRPSKPALFTRRAIEGDGQLVTRSDMANAEQSGCPGDSLGDLASMLIVPIPNDHSVIGVLSIQSNTAGKYTRSSLQTLQSLADHCGGALERIRTEEELRKTQEQLRQSQKLEAIGQLAGGVAHDFNNLLTVMRGNIELVHMHTKELKPVSMDCLNQVVGAIDRAAGLTRQLLAFSRKQLMKFQPLDLNEILSNLTKMLQRLIGEDIQLQCIYAARLPMVQADAGMLEQSVINLAVNARDAMPKGGQLAITTRFVKVEEEYVQTHHEARVGQFVALTVRDSGTGISPEHLPHIFEPFFTTKDIGKGTGLGLATVYGIMKQHQGWIEAESKLGSGSSFTIFLPAADAEKRPAIKARVASKPRGGTESILLVEDEEPVRRLTKHILEHFGYRVYEANSGKAALELFQKEPLSFDLLLTDVIMPEGVTGRELAEQLRMRKPDLGVIFTSGYSGEVLQGAAEFMQTAEARFIPKPCYPHELLGAVREVLDAVSHA